MTHRIFLLYLAISAFVHLMATSAVGQSNDSIQPGARVRFAMPVDSGRGVPAYDELMVGTLLAISDGNMAIAVQGQSKTLVVPMGSAVNLEFQAPGRPATIQGARIGMMFGALLGGMFTSGVTGGGCTVNIGGNIGCPAIGGVLGSVAGSVLGLAVGYLMGKLFDRDRWQPVGIGDPWANPMPSRVIVGRRR